MKSANCLYIIIYRPTDKEVELQLHLVVEMEVKVVRSVPVTKRVRWRREEGLWTPVGGRTHKEGV